MRGGAIKGKATKTIQTTQIQGLAKLLPLSKAVTSRGQDPQGMDRLIAEHINKNRNETSMEVLSGTPTE